MTRRAAPRALVPRKPREDEVKTDQVDVPPCHTPSSPTGWLLLLLVSFVSDSIGLWFPVVAAGCKICWSLLEECIFLQTKLVFWNMSSYFRF
uniref:Uncharacterized protein n=1 Tax=Triticum urartu TaxID=4572 RepID=A0A8R7TZR9_TRIUA